MAAGLLMPHIIATNFSCSSSYLCKGVFGATTDGLSVALTINVLKGFLCGFTSSALGGAFSSFFASATGGAASGFGASFFVCAAGGCGGAPCWQPVKTV